MLLSSQNGKSNFFKLLKIEGLFLKFLVPQEIATSLKSSNDPQGKSKSEDDRETDSVDEDLDRLEKGGQSPFRTF